MNAKSPLGVLFIGMLIAASFWILLPFLTAILWATTIVVTTWPVLLGLQARFRGKRWPAVTVMTVLLLLVIIVPISLAVSTIVARVGDIAALGNSLAAFTIKAIRGVALGIVVTAVIQTSIGGIGFVVTGVPAAGVLIAVMFMLCLAQVGPALVLIPAIIWLYSKDGALWGTLLLVVSIIAITIDNVVRPILIRKGADLPLVMIIAGVIGGLVAFGILGLFIGPVVLAVSYTLLKAWVLADGSEGEAAAEGEEAEGD